jgi:hypothetical protein
MVPHGAGVGVYVRGALSGLRPDAHGLKTSFPNRLGRRSPVEPYGPTGGSLNRCRLGLSDRLYISRLAGNGHVASQWPEIAPTDF